MEKDNRKLLKDSLEIIRKYSNEEDAKVISSLLNKFDSNELDENTLNQLVHNYYSPQEDVEPIEVKKNNERSAR